MGESWNFKWLMRGPGNAKETKLDGESGEKRLGGKLVEDEHAAERGLGSPHVLDVHFAVLEGSSAVVARLGPSGDVPRARTDWSMAVLVLLALPHLL